MPTPAKLFALWNGLTSQGSPLAGGTVHAFEPGTNQPKKLWTTVDQTDPGITVVTLNNDGKALVYGDGIYKIEVRDSNNNLIETWEHIFFAHEVVNAKDFGAYGDGDINNPNFGHNDTAALQAALDYCMSVGATLFIPAGVYRLTDTLQVNRVVFSNSNIVPDRFNSDPATTEFTFFGVGVEGEKKSVGSTDSVLFMTRNDRPVMAIQAGIGVSISRLGFVGQNNFTQKQDQAVANDPDHTNAFLLDDNMFSSSPNPETDPNRPRDGDVRLPVDPKSKPVNALASPYAAIAVDPFSGATTLKPVQPPLPGQLPTGNLPLDGGYPGGVNQNNYVRASSGSTVRSSSGIVIAECSFSYFIVGILISPTGAATNGDDITIRNCYFSRNKIMIASCSTQNRSISVYDISAYNCLFVFSGASYGGSFAPPSQGGPMGQIQTIQGGQVSSAKYLFNLSGSYAEATSVSGLYAEATLSLGFFGQGAGLEPVVFQGCSFNFDQPIHHRSVDSHCVALTNLLFDGCSFGMNDGSQPIRFQNRGHLAFSSCSFLSNTTEDLFPSPTDPWLSVGSGPTGFATFENFDQVTFNDCWVRGAWTQAPNYNAYLRGSYKTQKLASLERTLVPPGALIAAADHPANLYRVSAKFKDIPLTYSGTPNLLDIFVTVDPKHDGVVIFKTNDADQHLKPGDVVYAPDGWVQETYRDPLFTILNQGACGVVQNVDGNIVTMVAVAQGLVFELSKLGKPKPMKLSVRYTPRFHLPTEGQINQGSPFITLSPQSAQSIWLPKDRIWGDGIPPGAFILKSSWPQLEISAPATMGGTVRLYDADVYQFTGTPV
ncbi:MAG TPA: hypothetical protein VGC87_15575 [Pyrinomonadaceae bacterium]|jgi:hypothetical protein